MSTTITIIILPPREPEFTLLIQGLGVGIRYTLNLFHLQHQLLTYDRNLLASASTGYIPGLTRQEMRTTPIQAMAMVLAWHLPR